MQHDQSTSISTVLFFNAQSLSGKVHDLHNFIFSRPIVPFVIGVVETSRIVNNWNSLPDTVITAPNINIFKNKLDEFWKDQDIKFKYRETLNLAGSRTRE